MHFHPLPFYKALIVVAAIGTAYALAVTLGHAPACVPNLEGCTSLSALGRTAPESFVFRALLIPVGVLTMLYWVLNRQWLILLGDDGRGGARTMLVIGLMAGVAYIFYLSMLGADGQATKLIRGIWVTLFFAFMFLAQLFLVNRIWKLGPAVRVLLGWPYRVMLGVSVVQLVLGFLVVPIEAFARHADWAKNAVEWNFGLLLVIFYISSGFAWHRTGFQASLSVNEERNNT
ncbi:MAG: hypothetical protein E2O56_02090 [Gammaproteobacteria bacterium]|nr:MAG: hypothetical protein E2O56_02090 [Gammaproteobacteria bacterium]